MSQAPTGLPFAKTEVLADGTALVTIGGSWKIDQTLPSFLIQADRAKVVASGLVDFDSSLPAWIYANFKTTRELDLTGLPKRLQSLVLIAEKKSAKTTTDEGYDVLEQFGSWGIESSHSWGRALEHIGHTAWAFFRTIIGKAKVNWADFSLQLQTTGVDALPIVALLGFLTGLIMAYVGLIQLRQVGATVYVANLVSLAMTREMGALMTGVIACGRTATAFASQLGSMKVSQETDALRVLGINPTEYIELPRILAVTLMLPLLSVFATFIGIIGGMVVACAGDLSISQYFAQALSAITIRSLMVGIIKAVAFGFIAAWSGCYRGHVAKPSASGVGDAATSAAVLGITLMVIADAIFAVLFNLFNM